MASARTACDGWILPTPRRDKAATAGGSRKTCASCGRNVPRIHVSSGRAVAHKAGSWNSQLSDACDSSHRWARRVAMHPNPAAVIAFQHVPIVREHEVGFAATEHFGEHEAKIVADLVECGREHLPR